MRYNYRNIQTVCTLYIAAWLLAPPLAYGTIYRIIAVAATLLWFLFHILKNNRQNDRNVERYLKRYIFCSVFYTMTLLVFRCIYDDLSIFNAFYNDITTYILLCVGYIGGVYIHDMRQNDLRKIFYFVITVAVVFSLTSIFRSGEYYLLTRNAGGISAEDAGIAISAAEHGVGGFGFFCFTSVFTSALLWCFYNCRGRVKILYLLSFVILEAGVLSAGYTLALLISCVGICLCIIQNVKSSITKMFVLLSVIVLLILWNEISSVLYTWLYRLTLGTMYNNKVVDIFAGQGTFSDRQERYMLSLQSIANFPVLGSYLLAGTRSVGYHSSILDTFAAYGWFIGAIWFYIIVVYPVKLIKPVSGTERIGRIVAILLMLTATFNQTTMMMGAFYLALPALPFLPCVTASNQKAQLQNRQMEEVA